MKLAKVKANAGVLAKRTIGYLSKNSPNVMTVVGAVGIVASVGLAIKATPKAMQIVKEKEIERGKMLSKSEVVKETWKCYVPCAITTAVSIGCVIGAGVESNKRNAALAAAYTISEATRKEYQEKTKAIIGETKEKKIRDEIAKEKVEKAPVPEALVIGDGQIRCFDTLTGRSFLSDMQTIRSVVNDINSRLIEEMSVSLNEFYYELGLDEVDVGDKLGWRIDRGKLDVTYSSILDKQGNPCLAISFDAIPNYSDLY